MLRPSLAGAGSAALGAGALGSAAGAFLFISNIWRTLPGNVRLQVTARRDTGARP